MFFVSTAYPGTPLYDQAVAQGTVEPRWWATQAWDPRKNSAFQARWGWTAKGGLTIPGFDSEYWQRTATRAFYLRPYFIWDTLVFTVKNPYFARHSATLGKSSCRSTNSRGPGSGRRRRRWSATRSVRRCWPDARRRHVELQASCLGGDATASGVQGAQAPLMQASSMTASQHRPIVLRVVQADAAPVHSDN